MSLRQFPSRDRIIESGHLQAAERPAAARDPSPIADASSCNYTAAVTGQCIVIYFVPWYRSHYSLLDSCLTSGIQDS